MAELSPARAILAAFRQRHAETLRPGPFVDRWQADCLAAALRAAADGWRTEVGGITQTDFIRGVLRSAEALEEIANELEALQ